MKKVFLAILIFLLFTPFLVEGVPEIDKNSKSSYDSIWTIGADPIPIWYDGIVPCGRCLRAEAAVIPRSELEGFHGCKDYETFVPCELCHSFIMFDHIINFMLTVIIPGLAVLVIVFSGVMMIIGSANPDQVKKAKSAFIWSVAGIFLAYASWAIVTVLVSSFMDWDIEWTTGGIEVNHMCEVRITERDFD